MTQLCSWLDAAQSSFFVVEMLALIIPLHRTVKAWLVQLMSLCKATKLSYKVTKLYKAAELLYKMTESFNTTDDEGFGAKFWRSCAVKISYAPKFQDVALSIIGCEKNWLQ